MVSQHTFLAMHQIYICGTRYTFLSNHNAHKTFDVWFWAPNLLIESIWSPKNKCHRKFYDNCDLTKNVSNVVHTKQQQVAILCALVFYLLQGCSTIVILHETFSMNCIYYHFSGSISLYLIDTHTGGPYNCILMFCSSTICKQVKILAVYHFYTINSLHCTIQNCSI